MANPTTITQYPEPGADTAHIPWREDEFQSLTSPNGTSVELNGSLHHIARAPDADLRNKTWFIQATGYRLNSLPSQLNGIVLNLHSQRRGRVTDDTVQLCLGGKLIGKNQADLSINTLKTYGSPTDLWGTDLSIEDIMDPSFGIVVRFQSHPTWPHRDGAFIGALDLVIY
jgi:hypothetical protein